MSLEHEVVFVDLLAGEQRQSDFLAINPSGRIPVIIDQIDGNNHVISQTGAILIYLAEQSGLYLPQDPKRKAVVLQWLLFQLTDISSNVFNNFYLKSLVKPSQDEAAELLKSRALSFYAEFDQQLQDHEYIAGADPSIADFAMYPVVYRLADSEVVKKFKHLMRWFDKMSQRPVINKMY